MKKFRYVAASVLTSDQKQRLVILRRNLELEAMAKKRRAQQGSTTPEEGKARVEARASIMFRELLIRPTD